MKNSTKFLGILVLAAACFCMTACSDGDGDDGNFSLASLKTPEGVKSVYLSDIAVNGSGRAAAGDDTISSLSYLTSTGQNAPVAFSTPSGKKRFIFEVTRLEQLGERCIIICIDGYYEVAGTGDAGSYTVGPKEWTETKSVLIDMKNGKLYDFSEFQDRWNSRSRFMEGDIIYTVNGEYDGDTVYKIDLSTASVDSALKAVPLNNGALMPIRLIMLPYTISNKLIVRAYTNNLKTMCLDVSGAIQPVEYKWVADVYGSEFMFETQALIRDLTGKPWFSLNNYAIYEVSIDDSGQCVFGSVKTVQIPAHEPSYNSQIFTFNAAGVGNNYKNLYGYYRSSGDPEMEIMRSFLNNGVVMIYSNGFIRLRPEVDGIKVESSELALPAKDSLMGKSVISSENYLFWLENKTIKRQKLEAGSSAQVVYSNSGIMDIVTTRDLLTASGRKLIFYQYAEGSATEVHTFSLDMYNPNAQPELLATNDAEVRSIVELNF
jgi:hypothetical protein